ncbi:MAG: carboxypeptidase-like regulatory domain-containing protein [Saprospiraceae bacterium]
MIRQIIVTSFLVIITTYLHGQTISGMVLNKDSQIPIEFVNIGVLENPNGTVSSENGEYKLNLNETDQTIRFSSIGFESQTFLKEDLAKVEKVYLQPITYDIGMVNINSKRFEKQKKIGKRIRSRINTSAWGGSKFSGLEIGVPIKIKKESLLKSAHFGILKSSTSNTRLRVNIYEFKNGKIGKNLMTENLLVKVQDIIKYGKIDLSHLNLVVTGDVLLSLETVEQKEAENFYLIFGTGVFFKGNIFTRDASQATFRKEEINDRSRIGAFLKVKQVK